MQTALTLIQTFPGMNWQKPTFAAQRKKPDFSRILDFEDNLFE